MKSVGVDDIRNTKISGKKMICVGNVKIIGVDNIELETSVMFLRRNDVPLIPLIQHPCVTHFKGGIEN